MNKLILSRLALAGSRATAFARCSGIAVWQRFASTQVEEIAAKTTESDLTSKVHELPQVSGGGPFPEAPKFEVLGHPSSLLHVSLPASSSVYTRRGSVVAVNGPIEGLTSSLNVDGSLRKLMTGTPVLYQKVTSTSPVTLLISDSSSRRGGSTSFAVVETNNSTQWIIAQRKALLGWTGTASVGPHPGFSAWSSIKASGAGEIAIVGQGQLFQVEIAEGEQIELNPSNVVAYTEPSEKGQLRRVPLKLINLDLPVLESLISRWTTRLPAVNHVRNWVATAASKLRIGDRLALRVKGPCAVLVQTHSTPVRELFSSEELNGIIQQKT